MNSLAMLMSSTSTILTSFHRIRLVSADLHSYYLRYPGPSSERTLSVLFETLCLILVHLLADEQQHVRIRFFERRSGLCHAIDRREDGRLIQSRLSGDVFQLRFFLLERLVADQVGSLLGLAYIIHLLSSFTP